MNGMRGRCFGGCQRMDESQAVKGFQRRLTFQRTKYWLEILLAAKGCLSFKKGFSSSRALLPFGVSSVTVRRRLKHIVFYDPATAV